MSQHYWKTVTKQNQQCTVQIGWDRPLQTFFCTVFDESPVEDNKKVVEERVLYSSLYDRELITAQYVGLGYFEIVLKERFGIVFPNTMLKALLGDKEENAGNKIMHWK